MPIYEFYCKSCHMIFNFFSRSINTKKRPKCPKCEVEILERQMSSFALTGRVKGDDPMDDIPIDEGKMEQAIQMLAGEAERIPEDDPRQAASLMRKLTRMTGLELGDGMEEALHRMESGDDPEKIEADMGDILENEDPFQAVHKKGGKGERRQAPERDETLYDL